MDKERIKAIKSRLWLYVTNPLEGAIELSLYIVTLAVGIWILGFALAFLTKVMKPMIFLT